MLAAAVTTPRNQLLGALPQNEYQRLLPSLKRVEMPLGKIIYEVGAPINHIYFPEDSIVSTVSFFEDGASIETGITGREGMTGVGVALSNDTAERETSVQAEGYAWQISTEKFRAVFERGGSFQHLVLRYVYAFLEQIAQSGACINHHPVNQRLARWLLMCHDRTDGDELRITHDFISQMLGVNRPSVTGAAIELKDEGLIKYSRGKIIITDRKGLEEFTCECYESIKRVYNQYLSLLEIRQLNQRLEKAGRQMAGEIERRRKIEVVTRDNMQNLKQAVADIRNLPVRVRICRNCHRMCDSRNNRRLFSEYLGRRLNAEFVPVICSVCAEE